LADFSFITKSLASNSLFLNVGVWRSRAEL
jgi:hypothetical protein